MLCFTSNENCHFSSGKTVTIPNWLLISFGTDTFRKPNHGNRRGFRRNKLQQQQQLILEIVEDFASEDKTLEIFRDFALFLHFLFFSSVFFSFLFFWFLFIFHFIIVPPLLFFFFVFQIVFFFFHFLIFPLFYYFHVSCFFFFFISSTFCFFQCFLFFCFSIFHFFFVFFFFQSSEETPKRAKNRPEVPIVKRTIFLGEKFRFLGASVDKEGVRSGPIWTTSL